MSLEAISHPVRLPKSVRPQASEIIPDVSTSFRPCFGRLRRGCFCRGAPEARRGSQPSRSGRGDASPGSSGVGKLEDCGGSGQGAYEFAKVHSAPALTVGTFLSGSVNVEIRYSV
jgi:hypothetical protein